MTSKTIVSITPNGKPWGDPPNGPLYPFKIEFDDGMVGVANAKVNPPAYKAGDLVGVEVTGQDARGNNKLKIDRKWPQNNPGATGSAFVPSAPQNVPNATQSAPNAATQAAVHPATAGCAFKAAIDVLDKRSPSEACDPAKVLELAAKYVKVLQYLESGKTPQPKVVQQAVQHAKAVGFSPESDERDDPF